MTPRELVVEEARNLKGTKWRHQGRKPWAIDCIGLIVLALRAGGVDIEDRLDYGREPWNDGLQAELEKRLGPPIYVHNGSNGPLVGCQPGDVAVFRWLNKAPCHVGILGEVRGELTVIHSHSLFNTTEHHLDVTWKRLLVEVYSPWLNS